MQTVALWPISLLFGPRTSMTVMVIWSGCTLAPPVHLTRKARLSVILSVRLRQPPVVCYELAIMRMRSSGRWAPRGARKSKSRCSTVVGDGDVIVLGFEYDV